MYSPFTPLVGTLVDIQLPKIYFLLILVEDALRSQHLLPLIEIERRFARFQREILVQFVNYRSKYTMLSIKNQ